MIRILGKIRIFFSYVFVLTKGFGDIDRVTVNTKVLSKKKGRLKSIDEFGESG